MKKIYSLMLAAVLALTTLAQQANLPLSNKLSKVKAIKQNSLSQFISNKSTHAISQSSTSAQAAPIWTDDLSNAANWVISNDAGNTDNWVIGTAGPACQYKIDAIKSTTAANNFGLFDSDCLCSGNQHGHLTTKGSIDLTAYTAVQLIFEQQFRSWLDTTLVGVSPDGGTTWTYIEVNGSIADNGYSANNPDTQIVDISALAGGKADVKIRFTFRSRGGAAGGGNQGCGYSWMVDDVSIVETPKHDVSILDAYYTSYSYTPLAQVTPINFAADILNKGGSKETNVSLNIDVNDGSSSVFNNKQTIDSLLVTIDSIIQLSAAFTPSSMATYDVEFLASMDSTDLLPIDNTVTGSFIVSDTVYARDNGIYTGSGLYNGAGNGFEMGNYFEIFNTQEATSISVYLHGYTDEGLMIKGKIYSIDGAGNFTEVVASSPTATDSGGAKFITIPFTTPFTLDSGNYVAAIQVTTGDKVAIASGSDQIQPLGACLLYDLDSATWYSLTGTPMVRLNLSTPCNLTASYTSINVKCNGETDGSIDVTANGGTAPFIYSWSNTATTQDLTGLKAGSYTVVVTDNGGCKATKVITITEPTAITVTSSITQAACGASDGKISVSASGATPGYSYSWSGGNTSNSVTGLSAGIYTVTVTDSLGCKKTQPVGVSNVGAPSIVITSSSNISCFGYSDGTAKVSITGGGISPFSYLWSNGDTTNTASNLPSGNTVVQVADSAGCIGTASVTIQEPAGMNVNASISAINCNGGTNGAVVISVSGGTTPYSYVWSTGATTDSISNLSAGTYGVTITDGSGCDIVKSITVTAPNTISITLTPKGTVGGNNGSVTSNVTGGTPPYAYAWSNGGNGSSITNLAIGTYTLEVTDSKGCIQSASTSITGERDELSINNNILLYPNPSQGKIFIEINTISKIKKISISVYDILGQRILNIVNGQTNDKKFTLDLSKLNKGVYFMHVEMDNNVITKKFMLTE